MTSSHFRPGAAPSAIPLENQASSKGRTLKKAGTPSSTPNQRLPRRGRSSGNSRLGPLARRQRRYFVHMLVGVYPSYEVARSSLRRNELARGLPVAFERNSNGLGQCKAWLAVSKPFLSRTQAQEAQRRLAPFVGDGAVTVRLEA